MYFFLSVSFITTWNESWQSSITTPPQLLPYCEKAVHSHVMTWWNIMYGLLISFSIPIATLHQIHWMFIEHFMSTVCWKHFFVQLLCTIDQINIKLWVSFHTRWQFNHPGIPQLWVSSHKVTITQDLHNYGCLFAQLWVSFYTRWQSPRDCTTKWLLTQRQSRRACTTKCLHKMKITQGLHK